jgi:hypothetical protein
MIKQAFNQFMTGWRAENKAREAIMTGLLGNFETVTLRSGEAVEFVGSEGTSFVWDTGSPGLIEGLQEAVGALRQYLAERSLDAGVRAAREGIESVLGLSGQRQALHDSAGLLRP